MSKINNDIAILLHAVAVYEEQCEQVKLYLCEYPQFNPAKFFDAIDYRSKGKITINNLLELIENFQETEKLNIDDFKLIFRAYTGNTSGEMRYEEFLKVIIPRTNSKISKQCLARKVFQSKFKDYDKINTNFKLDLFHREIFELFFFVLRKEVECLNNLYRIAADMYSLHGAQVIQACKALENNFCDITFEKIQELMTENQLEFTNQDYLHILNRLHVARGRKLKARNIIKNIFDMTHPNYYHTKDYFKLRSSQHNEEVNLQKAKELKNQIQNQTQNQVIQLKEAETNLKLSDKKIPEFQTQTTNFQTSLKNNLKESVSKFEIEEEINFTQDRTENEVKARRETSTQGPASNMLNYSSPYKTKSRQEQKQLKNTFASGSRFGSSNKIYFGNKISLMSSPNSSLRPLSQNPGKMVHQNDRFNTKSQIFTGSPTRSKNPIRKYQQ